MTSDIALVDLWASSGRSPWHRASALAKMTFLAALLFAAITARDPRVPAVLVGLVLACLATARIPLGPALLLGIYPFLFSSLFVLSRWDGTWQTPALLLARSLASSLGAVLLVATTPYPDLFAPIARVTPIASRSQQPPWLAWSAGRGRAAMSCPPLSNIVVPNAAFYRKPPPPSCGWSPSP